MKVFSQEKFASIVLYEDNHLLVVSKPPGLLAQGDATGRPNLLDWGKDYLKEKYGKPGRVFLGLVHRLDRQAGGVMVLARTSKAAGRLSAQFREHRIRKIYQAVVAGHLSPPMGDHATWLARIGHKSVVVSEGTEGAQSAHLSWRTLETGPQTSLIEIDLHTGRRHQIRAQMATLGHPLLGDIQYGSAYSPRMDAIALLARQLTLYHPTGKEPMDFEAPIPPDWPWLPLP